MSLVLVTPPSDEPVTLKDVKLDMRVDDDVTEFDSLISSYITAGRQHAETYCRRAFMPQQWRITSDRFPSPMAGRLTEYWLGQAWGLAGMGGVSQFPMTDRTGYGFLLPISPVISVDSIVYTDTGGVPQTLAPAAYLVDTDSEPARVLPAFGYAWPSTRQQINSVKLTFTAGFPDDANVLTAAKAAIIMYVKAHFDPGFEDVRSSEYERRMKSIEGILRPHRIMAFG